jgi:hypothetical protein
MRSKERVDFMTNIEKCRALTVAMNSLRYNLKLDTIEVQSHEFALGAMISEVEQAGKWISVNDDLPPQGHQVMIYCEKDNTHSHNFSFAQHINGEWRWRTMEVPFRVTHWQPMPEIPKCD